MCSPGASPWSASRRAGFDEVPTPFAAVSPGVELQATVLDNVLAGTRAPPAVVARAARGGSGDRAGAPRRRRVCGGCPGRWGGSGRRCWRVGLPGRDADAVHDREASPSAASTPPADVLLATIGGAVYRSVVEEGEKRKIRDAFAALREPRDRRDDRRGPGSTPAGRRAPPASRCSSRDIRGFTGMAEHLPPETLGELLNHYLEAMTDVVFTHGGLLDKYIGDAVMAFWGAPADAPDHAIRCCEAALDMRAALERLNQSWHAAGLPRIRRSGSASTAATPSSATSAPRDVSATPPSATT